MKKNELPSLEKLCNDTKIALPFALLFRPDQAKQVMELHQKASSMKKQIELFCERFSDRGWCIYDRMKLSVIEEANKVYDEKGIDAAELVLISFYKGEAKEVTHWIKNSDKAFGIRYNLLQHFFEQHFAERYYSSIPLALMIIDGAVNDYTKSKGFFADGTDVDAWDCIVGCSDALAKVRDIFRKNRTKTNTESIIMPYRNGILHGRDLNYANEYVACKCLALMFAVSDWMRMKNNEERRKEKFEKDSNPPPILDSLKRYQQIQKDKKEIGEWKRRDVQIGVDIPETGDASVYSEYPYIMAVVEMLETWKSKNYGSLGEQLSLMFPEHSTAGKRAGACRSLFANKEFQSFHVVSVKEEGCCMSGVEIQVEWTTNSQTYQGNLVFGCVYENEQRNALPWNENGTWKLYPRDVRSLHFPKLKEI